MRLTVTEISLANLAHNVKFLRDSVPHSDILAIVKANAYGHGMLEISAELNCLGVSIFGVAFADEGVSLRQSGIEGKIIVLVPETNGNAKLCVDYDLTPVAYHRDFLEILDSEANKQNKIANYHLFVDTGMNREGVRPEQSVDFMKFASGLKNIRHEGICTHFAAAWSSPQFTETQLILFNQTLGQLKSAGFEFNLIHAANSTAAIKNPESRFNVFRPGIALYGYPPTTNGDEDFPLKPVMTLKTKVSSVRRISKGETVGYSLKYISDAERNIATIPIGYGDGLFRNLTGIGECLIRGRRFKLVGTICMDSCMVDIGDEDIQPGEEVIIIGEQGNETINAYEIAEKLGTIPYEITTAISARVPRKYI
jgi:alanine racemase